MDGDNKNSNIYLYSVYPKKVIRELPTLPIRHPKSLYLDKDQVLICLKYGSVYRRFANENRNERVTISNLDRLHNDKFMTEEEYEKFKLSKIADNRGSIINENLVDPVNTDEQSSDVNIGEKSENEVTADNKVEETFNTDEQLSDTNNINETGESVQNVDNTVDPVNTDEQSSDVNIGEKSENEVTADNKVEENNKKETSDSSYNNSNKYGGKNNKHRK